MNTTYYYVSLAAVKMRPEKKIYACTGLWIYDRFHNSLFTKDRKFPPPPRTIPVENKLSHAHSVQEIYSAETVIGVT